MRLGSTTRPALRAAVRAVAAVAALCATAQQIGCDGSSGGSGGLEPTPDLAVEPGPDLARHPDLGPAVNCPPPRELGPADLPAGYFEAAPVELDHPIDGDTAAFVFPATSWDNGGLHTVRFLFVNTEESYGADKTAFGIATKGVIAEYLRNAKSIAVAVQRDTKPNLPNKDLFGRLLGLVFVDGKLFQTRIVDEGWSAYYTDFGCAAAPIHSALLYAEAEAWVAQRGVWEPNHPTDYREVLERWIGDRRCRPNPYTQLYCP